MFDSNIVNGFIQTFLNNKGGFRMANDKIGSRIKEIRNYLECTQNLFANRLGISRSHISNIENGKENPSSSLVRLISAMFHINEDWIWTGEGQMKVNEIKATEEVNENLEYNFKLYKQLISIAHTVPKKEIYVHLFACLLTISCSDSYYYTNDLNTKQGFEFLEYTDNMFQSIAQCIAEIRTIADGCKPNDFEQILNAKTLCQETSSNIQKYFSLMCKSIFEENKIEFTP